MTPPPSDHFNGKTFFQPHQRQVRFVDFLRWRFSGNTRRWPARVPLPVQPPRPAPAGDEVVATWLGHATFLLESTRGNFLCDPVFSDRASPFTWAGPRRVHPPPVALDALPPLTAVLVSHDHYDHLDARSLRALAQRHPDAVFIAPWRHHDLLSAAGARQIVELDWWQTHRVGAVDVTLTPTKHWSNRLGTPRNHRLWGGFSLEFPIGDCGLRNGSAPEPAARLPEIRNPKSGIANASGRRIWFAGDTGYDRDMFVAIRDRLGPPDLALVPIGAYEPRWFMAPMHINPAEAVRVHRDIGARRSVGMHWGTFQLTDEGRDEPGEALVAARTAAGLAPEDFLLLPPGASVIG